MADEIPPEVTKRVKQPYMAPDSNCFVQDDSPEYVAEMFSEPMINEAGLFNAAGLTRLVRKCRRLADKHLSFRDNMAFVGALSTQLLWYHFVKDFKQPTTFKREAFKVWQDESSTN